MKKISVLWILWILLSVSTWAQKDLITADAFMSFIKENPEAVVLDANKSKNYKAAHITDAIYINHNDLYKDGDIKGLIKNPAKLAAMFGELGIDMNTPVIVTDDGSQKYSSRVYWILQYLGHENVQVLHKDKDLWRNARIPLTASVPKAKTAKSFLPKLCPEYMATMKEVEMAMGDQNKVLVDSRTFEEFMGTDGTSAGHIPQAINLNYEDLLTDTGAFKSVEELQQIADKMGLMPDKEIIFYCKTSIRAAVPFFAFRNILGYENIKVYDGAYLEWISKKEIVQ